MKLATNHNLKFSRDAVHHSDIIIKANSHLNWEENTLSYPSDLTQTLRLADHGDVAAFEVHEYT